MKSRISLLMSLAVLVAMLASGLTAAASAGTASIPGTATMADAPDGIYIIRLVDAPCATYRGGIEGLQATSPEVTGAAKLDVTSPASVTYLDYLAGRHNQFIAAMEQALNRSVEVLFRYDVVLNGLAARLSSQEAAQVAALAGVVTVQPQTIEYPDTDVGPTWIGAPGIWDGSAVPGGVGTQGEGVIVGVIDTGINHDHPSFADVGEDGYDHTNPWGSGVYVGYCVTDDPSFCNDKLIGAWSFVNEDITPEDSDGHGSHTSSTAAGNHITAFVTTPSGYVVESPISGVAPHANIIMYDACVTSCPSAALLASVNQAVADGVDAINYSISGGSNPYYDQVELAFLDATAAGVFVSTSAGNNGPGPGTVAHRSPWVSTVAAATHNRLYANELADMAGGDTQPPADIVGQSISLGVGPAPIVYAGDYGDPLCGSPFPPDTWTNEIVVCDRGIYGRVDKGANVLAGGADGYVLANDAANGNSLVADPHMLPAIHITYDDGVALKAWMASGSGHMATITETSTDLDPNNGDIMASFSSRGPNTTLDVIKPDMSAPGVAILAAYLDGIEITWLGGTSMSSPHNAGAGALMKALYPTWSPSEIKSAIMGTAWNENLRKEDGVTPADPFDVGAGRDNLLAAAKAGIVFDETADDYLAANPNTGGDPKTLNLASLQNNECGGTCSWTREVKSTQDATVNWTASGEGMGFTFSPATFDLSAGATQEIVITADVAGLPIGSWAFGAVTLTPDNPDLPVTRLPVAVNPSEEPPVIVVSPESMASSQPPDTIEVQELTIANEGVLDLEWELYEDAGGGLLEDWYEDWDSYPTGQDMHGVGGWKGWGDDPAYTAFTTDAQALSSPNSIDIVDTADLVHEYTGYDTGFWTYTAWQYIPGDFSGESYFLLLNQYDDAGVNNNWSTQVHFQAATDMVIADGAGAGQTLPIIYDEWVEIRVEIDLINDNQAFYYGDDLLFEGSWTEGMSGGGILNIGAVDLYANAASSVYYDDLSLVEAMADVCDVPSEIPWVSAWPEAGTTPGGESDLVDVTFDSTGLVEGTYEGTLCVLSNDPATPIVPVPLTLEVIPMAGTMHVEAIDGRFQEPFLVMKVQAADQDGLPLGHVLVDATITMPFGEWERWRYSKPTGWARFWAPLLMNGNYEICVDNLTLEGYVYNPDDNVVTCMDWDW